MPACIASPHLGQETPLTPAPTTAGRGGDGVEGGKGCGAQTPQSFRPLLLAPALGSRVKGHCGLIAGPPDHQVPGPALSTLQTLLFNYRGVPMQRDQCSPCGLCVDSQSMLLRPPGQAARPPVAPTHTCGTRGQACSRLVRCGWDPVPRNCPLRCSESRCPHSGGCAAAVHVLPPRARCRRDAGQGLALEANMILSSRGVLTGDSLCTWSSKALLVGMSGQASWVWWSYGGPWGSCPSPRLPFPASLDPAPDGPGTQLTFATAGSGGVGQTV